MSPLSVYLVANRASFPDLPIFLDKITAAVQGGVTCVQLRDFTSTALQTAKQLQQRLGKIPLFINATHALFIAEEIKAQGVFLEKPLPYPELKSCWRHHIITGLSAKTMDDVCSAERYPTDPFYLSVKVFPSQKTNPDDHCTWGLNQLNTIRQLSSHRIVAIGGMNENNAEEMYRSLRPGDGLAFAGALMDAPDPYTVAKRICAARDRAWKPTR